MISENLNQKEELESIVKEWLSIDDEISKLNFALKERKKKKQELTTYIMGFMKNNEIPFFNINNGKLIMLTKVLHLDVFGILIVLLKLSMEAIYNR